MKYLKFVFFILACIIIFSCKKDDNNNNNNNNNEGTISDADGNTYNTIIIGNQVWMKENLKTTKYCDSTTIPNVTDSAAWITLTTGAWCYYKNNISNNAVYGKMYNWYAVNTDILCPTGWHVPTSAEWIILADYLGGVDVAGGKLKETGITHWKTPNTGATNSSGFTALPGGYRGSSDGFKLIGEGGYWWTATEDITYGAWYIYMGFEFGSIGKFSWKKPEGYSVRCLKN